MFSLQWRKGSYVMAPESSWLKKLKVRPRYAVAYLVIFQPSVSSSFLTQSLSCFCKVRRQSTQIGSSLARYSFSVCNHLHCWTKWWRSPSAALLKSDASMFFGTGNQNYACCISWQIQEVEILPEAVKKDLHVIHMNMSNQMVVL